MHLLGVATQCQVGWMALETRLDQAKSSIAFLRYRNAGDDCSDTLRLRSQERRGKSQSSKAACDAPRASGAYHFVAHTATNARPSNAGTRESASAAGRSVSPSSCEKGAQHNKVVWRNRQIMRNHQKIRRATLPFSRTTTSLFPMPVLAKRMSLALVRGITREARKLFSTQATGTQVSRPIRVAASNT